MPLELPSEAFGQVFWLTGLSGAGKTTLGRMLTKQLRQKNHATVLLDGDVMRDVLGASGNHQPEQRRALAGQYGAMCRMLSRQGIDVVCATISMFHEVHQWNRTHIPNYHEIYLRVPLDVLIQRDTKGLYQRALAGEADNVLGINCNFEAPQDPELIIDNDGSRPPQEVLAELLQHLNLDLENKSEN